VTPEKYMLPYQAQTFCQAGNQKGRLGAGTFIDSAMRLPIQARGIHLSALPFAIHTYKIDAFPEPEEPSAEFRPLSNVCSSSCRSKVNTPYASSDDPSRIFRQREVAYPVLEASHGQASEAVCQVELPAPSMYLKMV